MLGVSLFVCVGAASAQTVIVKGAAAGTPIELVVNGASVATATADAAGLATAASPQSGTGTPTQTRMNLFVDRCGNARRVVLADTVAGAPPTGGCVRDTVPWRFMVSRVSTFVIDISGPAPSVRMTQGEAPKSWLEADAPDGEEAAWGPTPSGLIVFAGGGLGLFTGLTDVACGNVGCQSKSTSTAYAFGVQYWLTPMFAAEAQYGDPGFATAEGAGSGYEFESTLKARMLTVAGLVAAPLGRARIYGRGGMTRHGVNLITTQVNAPSSVTIDGVTETIPGHTQTFEIRTEAWSPVFGGGGEGWLSERFAIYGDVMRAWLKGDSIDAPEGRIDMGGWSVHAGIRFRIGGLGASTGQ